MPNYELDRLKTLELEAYHRKKSAWSAYTDAREQTSAAYEAMQVASEKRRGARDRLNCEFKTMVSTRGQRYSIWSEYYRTYDTCKSRMDAFFKEANAEHQAMLNCFAQAENEYENGNRSLAQIYALEGRDHKDRRNAFNDEARELRRKIRRAKQKAKDETLRLGGTEFHIIKAIYDQAKLDHQAAVATFKNFKAKSDQLKEAFDAAYDEHASIKAELRRKQAETKSKYAHRSA